MRLRVQYIGSDIHIQAYGNDKRSRTVLARTNVPLASFRSDKALREATIGQLQVNAAQKFLKGSGVGRYNGSKEK